MSYYMSCGGGSMSIKSENFPAIKSAVEKRFEQGFEVASLKELFAWFGFDYDEELHGIYFDCAELTDQEEFLETIAPWVEDHSRIEMTGEDDERWLWCFKDHEFFECNGTVIYHDDPYGKEH